MPSPSLEWASSDLFLQQSASPPQVESSNLGEVYCPTICSFLHEVTTCWAAELVFLTRSWQSEEWLLPPCKFQILELNIEPWSENFVLAHYFSHCPSHPSPAFLSGTQEPVAAGGYRSCSRTASATQRNSVLKNQKPNPTKPRVYCMLDQHFTKLHPKSFKSTLDLCFTFSVVTGS